VQYIHAFEHLFGTAVLRVFQHLFEQINSMTHLPLVIEIHHMCRPQFLLLHHALQRIPRGVVPNDSLIIAELGIGRALQFPIIL